MLSTIVLSNRNPHLQTLPQVVKVARFKNYALSKEVQERTAKALSESPVNTEVVLSKEDAKGLTYGEVLENAKTIDFKFVNSVMNDWIDKWNRIMN